MIVVPQSTSQRPQVRALPVLEEVAVRQPDAADHAAARRDARDDDHAEDGQLVQEHRRLVARVPAALPSNFISGKIEVGLVVAAVARAVLHQMHFLVAERKVPRRLEERARVLDLEVRVEGREGRARPGSILRERAVRDLEPRARGARRVAAPNIYVVKCRSVDNMVVRAGTSCSVDVRDAAHLRRVVPPEKTVVQPRERRVHVDRAAARRAVRREGHVVGVERGGPADADGAAIVVVLGAQD
mmetsp:Transcript_19780/g.56149  ORF Transcript_19780/g.56149 Transcript_19780/m.56149 type:complete len:243 (+) Transcript_19780:764-1492(+)